MRKALLILLFLFTTSLVFAAHIKGGFFTYKYLGPGAGGTLRYSITLTLYTDCNATEAPPPPSTGGQIDYSVNFSIFEASNLGATPKTIAVTKSGTTILAKVADEQCISGNQAGCYYKVVTYTLASIDLAANSDGYIISFQRCCRISGVDNIVNSAAVGNTYSIQIPGSATLTNSSATFKVNDTAVVCANSPFTIPFAAEDPDGDQLRYEFCSAWIGGTTGQPSPNPAAAPPYINVNYENGFSGSQPLGPNVTIDPVTGIISGIAPSIRNNGEYVVTVCVTELRGGIVVGNTRKELHVKVGNCSPIVPTLEQQYINCDNLTVTFLNKTPSPEIKMYSWDFGVGNTSTDVSDQPSPTYTYPAPGTYTVTVETNKGLACSASATAEVKIYPGFTPEFDFSGVCIQKPTQFTDKTVAQHGVVDKWNWDFGETTSQTDVSTVKNPNYQYPQSGIKNVRLIVSSSVGCKDTLTKSIEIFDKPPLSVITKDTLMCFGDTTQLQAFGNGTFSWTPVDRIRGENTATPEVWPIANTTYTVKLDDNGCINTETIQVRVVNFVTLEAMKDTTICLTDTIQLNANTNGLRFLWEANPASFIDNPTLLNPKTKPDAISTTYKITARIGKSCVDDDEVVVTTVPYPVVNAGSDTTICFDTQAQLHGQTNGTQYFWTPTVNVSDPNILDPIVRPIDTTSYILTALIPTSGCPKPKRDTVRVNVLPEIVPFAGRDTSVVVGQPLQFQATGGTSYVWSPGTGLSSTTIPNPIGSYNGDIESIRYKVLVKNGLCADSAYVTVKIFKTPPQIFIPTGFTPNNDNRNDKIRPIAVGITKIEYFRIFNRWGQMVFSTTTNGEGWDGKLKGKDQGSGVYVWVVKAIDYTGKDFFAKGTVTLIR